MSGEVTRPKEKTTNWKTTTCRVLALLLIAVLCLVALSCLAAPQAKANTNNPLTIHGDPLRIIVYDDSTFEVYHHDGATWQNEYYGKDSKGSVIFLNGGDTQKRYGGGYGTFKMNPPNFTPVSHTQPDPWTIVTVYKAGDTGVKIKETVSYRNGDNYYKVKYDISNNGVKTYNDVRFMNGCDAWFHGDDKSWGYWNNSLRMVYLTHPGLTTGIMGFYGDRTQSPANHYYEAYYGDVEAKCLSGNHLPDKVQGDFHDSAYALEWDRGSLRPGATWSVTTYEKWSEDANVQVFAPSDVSVDPGQTVNLTYSVVNFEAAQDTFNLAVTSALGWNVSVQPSSITLAAGVTRTVTVTVHVPANSLGKIDQVTLGATSATKSSITNSDYCRVHVGRQVTPGPRQTPDSYLCEGSTAWGFDCYLTVMNPNNSEIHVSVTYNTDRGAIPGQSGSMAPLSAASVDPRECIGDADFSAEIHCAEGLTIAADRTMSWGEPGVDQEATCSIGVGKASKIWYLAEGSTEWGFECWLAIQNPGETEANCRVTYMIENEGPRSMEVKVPRKSRTTCNMADTIGKKDASIKVESDVPIIAERAMYRNNRREGHASIGATKPANDFYLAEGAVGYPSEFMTYVLVQNPQNSPTDVSLTYMTQNGPVAGPSFQMIPNSRKTIRVNDQLPLDTNVSTKVHGSQPIIAERAMYWMAGTAEICHDSIGMDAPHSNFYLPDGWTENGRETWTLVQNPNDTDVKVKISYLTFGGTANVVKTEVIPANSRKTFDMASHSNMQFKAGIMVQSLSPGKKIMVERAMYWDNRGAGTDTIGGYSD